MERSHDDHALKVLKEQGFEIGESLTQDGRRRIWIRSKHDSALVEFGPELWELAAGRLTLADANVQRGRRDSESRGGPENLTPDVPLRSKRKSMRELDGAQGKTGTGES